MFPRIIAGVILSIVMGPAQADFLGLYVGGGYWNGSFAGDVISDVGVESELALEGDNNNYLYAAIEHPVPVLPNIRVARTSISDSGTGSLNSGFTFAGTTFNAGQRVATEIDLTHTDLTLYYELIDIGMDLDLGVTARFLDGDVRVDAAVEAVDVILPMLYLRGKLGLPFTGTYLGADVNAVSYSGSTISDFSLRLGWETENFILPEFGVETGYRRFGFDVDSSEIDVNVNMDVDGFFINLMAHF